MVENYYSSKYNHIYLYGTITNTKVLSIIKKIEKFNNTNKKIANDINQNSKNNINAFYVKAKPIVIHINSGGGDAFAGIALTNIIHKSNVPIITLIEGICMSAATFISMMAHKRIITKNSFMLIHQYSKYMKGTFKHEDLEFNQITGNKLLNDLYKIYINYSNLPKEKIKEMMKRDIFLTPTMCCKYKMVDEILETSEKNEMNTNKKNNKNNKKDTNSIYIYNESENNNNNNKKSKKKSDESSALPIVKKFHNILKLNATPKPLYVYVSETSFFESVLEVLPIINAIETSTTPINIVIEGPIGLYSLLYSIVGTSRTIYKYAYVIIDMVEDNINSNKLKDTVDNNVNIRKMIISILKKYTKLPKNIIKDLFTKRFLLNADECIKYNIVDKIVG